MKSFFKKKEKQMLETKPKKTKVRTVGTRKKNSNSFMDTTHW